MDLIFNWINEVRNNRRECERVTEKTLIMRCVRETVGERERGVSWNFMKRVSLM